METIIGMTPKMFLITLFISIVIGFLVIDLGWLNRKAHTITMRSAIIQTIFWIVISVIYGGLIYALLGSEMAAYFMSAYITEKMLSADNLMVILLLFIFFNIEEKYYHRVLFWGILGAVVMRGIFIFLGAYIVSQFHPILYVFGVFLIYTGLKIMFEKDNDDSRDFEDNRILGWCRRFLPISTGPHNGKFLTREVGKRCFTILFLVLIMVETTDIIFAVDSIPAVFAITQDPFIAYTSNIFAVMGLRALFFLIEKVLAKFPHLKKGIAFVLIFIGAKMFTDIFNIHLSPAVSFGIIAMALIGAIAFSLLFPQNQKLTNKKSCNPKLSTQNIDKSIA